MPTTLIFGGSGKVARHLTRLLVSQSHTVHSVIRNSAQVAELESLGAKPIVQSVEESSLAELTSTIKKCNPDTIVWTAGAGGQGGPERTKLVDQDGAIKSFDASAEAGVKRYIMISAVDVRDRSVNKYPDWYDEGSKGRSDKQWVSLGAYMEAKLQADKNLVTQNSKRGLAYTILRPGTLSADPAKGKINAGKVSIEPTVSREDVASVIFECIKNPATVGLAFDFVNGDTPIQEAVQGVIDSKVSTFQGQY
ncbi:MAG: hypothetical protein M1820_002990 [Bogoriella megaspora]|nr:MAG: hypothetical protein M1820_002990 [Bogoriella megaspora]